MTSSTLMAGVGVLVAALVAVAVVVAAFSGGEPAPGEGGAVPDTDKAGAADEPDRPLVDVKWKRGEGAPEEDREQPAVNKEGKAGKPAGTDTDSGQETD